MDEQKEQPPIKVPPSGGESQTIRLVFLTEDAQGEPFKCDNTSVRFQDALSLVLSKSQATSLREQLDERLGD